MNLAASVREYIDSLVHPSARDDLLKIARHRGFIAPRVLGGFLALAVLPLYLVARGAPSPLEAVVFGWLVTPISVAYFLARTGRYEFAHVLSALALTILITLIALMSGGISSSAAICLVLVPIEAALCASRRVVLIAVTLAFAAAGLLLAVGDGGLSVIAAPGGGPPMALIGLATVYAALLIFGAQSLARIGSKLLNQEEERYRLLALNMTDVISRHGRNGIALFVSPAAETLFGVPSCELLGHGLFDRVHVGDRPAYLSALAEAMTGSESRSVEFRVRRNVRPAESREAPHFLWVEMRCRAVSGRTDDNEQHDIRQVVAVMRDVTKRKEQEHAVEEARSEAEHANAAKSHFLATMSHELRTPLNAVIGFSEMLMHESDMQIDAKRRHDYARLIHDSGQHLLSVVNLVLDVSKIESGNFVITPEPFAPAAVIRNCCDLLALKAREAGLDIVLRLPAEIPELVADKRAMKQMLLNLLSNAVKFSNNGGQVTVSVVVDASHIGITVEDTGVGIDAKDLTRIGDPFFQAHTSYDRPYEGTGLGLSIVKGLVGLHGGQLQLESQLGVGTRVTIRLPLDCEKQQPNGRGSVLTLSGEPKADTLAAAGESPRRFASEMKKSA